MQEIDTYNIQNPVLVGRAKEKEETISNLTEDITWLDVNMTKEGTTISVPVVDSTPKDHVVISASVKAVIVVSLLLRAGGNAIGLIMGLYFGYIGTTMFGDNKIIGAATAAVIIT